MKMDIDIHEVIDAARTKPFGFQAFYPGPASAGHCIPIDPFYLSWRARQFDFRTRFIELAGEINRSMPTSSSESLAASLNERHNPSRDRSCWCWAWPYKRDIDDLRDSRPRLSSSICCAKKAPCVPTTTPSSLPWAADATTTST